MSQKTIDVVIPTYNGLPYLKQAVESVLQQSHKDLLLYIVDDGSKDDGATEKYARGLEDPRVKYLRKANGGQATARNYGAKASSSPYIAFLDSDDTWRPKKLARQLALMEANPAVGLVYGLCKLIDADGKVVGKVDYEKRGDLFKYLLKGNRITGSGSMVLVRREVFDKVGLFHEDFLIGEDWEMWLRIAKDYQIDYVADFIADLRTLDNGMQRNHIKMASGLEYMLPVMTSEFKLGLVDRAILAKACLRPACFMYLDGGDQASARRVLLKLLVANPMAILFSNLHQWLVYLRVLLGNKWLRSLRRRFSASYREREQNLKEPHGKA